MRDDQIRSRLVLTNPWWRFATSGGDATAWEAADQTLQSRKEFDLGYRPSTLADVASDPVDDKLVILRGPRRVGKSVLIKDTIAALCRRSDVDPRQIVYLTAESMRAADLNRVATIGRELTRSVEPARRIWLLDDVTSISGWTEAIKFLRGETPFGGDTVVCTGSSWDGSSEAERDLLTGRAGTASTRRVRLLLPMSFRDVATSTKRPIPLPKAVPLWELQGDRAKEAAVEAELYADELDLAWQSYLDSGGFPRAVAEHASDGRVSDSFVQDLGAWLHREVDKDDAPDSTALLLAELSRRSTSPLNRRDIAEELGYPNSQTLNVRLNRLVNSFGAIWCRQIDDTGRHIKGTQPKLYLVDPLVAHLGHRSRAGLATAETPTLNENALGVALARAVEEVQPGRWMAQDTIGYFRTAKGNEIDFSPVRVPTASGDRFTTPVEGKWVATGWRKGALTMENKFGRGVFATRSIVDTSHPAWALPAGLVALLLG